MDDIAWRPRQPHAPPAARGGRRGVRGGGALVLVSSVTSVSGDAGEPAPTVPGVALGGPGDVAAQTSAYAPWQSSDWHSHTGLHAVVVLSGTLTVVDGEYRRQTYSPGDSDVGGQDVYLAVDESSAALDLGGHVPVPRRRSHTGFHIPAPAPPNCEIPMNQDRACGVQSAGGKAMRSQTADEDSSDRSRHGVAAVALVATLVAAGEGYAAGWAAYRAVNETDESLETRVTNHARR